MDCTFAFFQQDSYLKRKKEIQVLTVNILHQSPNFNKTRAGREQGDNIWKKLAFPTKRHFLPCSFTQLAVISGFSYLASKILHNSTQRSLLNRLVALRNHRNHAFGSEKNSSSFPSISIAQSCQLLTGMGMCYSLVEEGNLCNLLTRN